MTFDPTTLSNKVLWLRGKDLGTGNVSTWTDQSGRGHDGTTSNSTITVVDAASTPNSGKSLKFNGNGYFSLPALSGVVATADSAHYGPAGPDGAADKAFDGNASTFYTVDLAAAGGSAWIRAQLANPVALTRYEIRRRDDLPNRNPKDWTFEGSNDGSSWTTLDTRSGITWPTSGETKAFTFSNTTSYLYYRLNVSATVSTSGGDTYLSIAEINLITEAEVWVVVKATGSSAGLWGMGGVAGNGSDLQLYPFSDGNIYESFGVRTGQRRSFAPSVALTSWRLYRVKNDGTTWQAWIDNTSQASASAGPVGWASTIRLGDNTFPSYFNGGRVAEILIREKVSTSDEVSWLIDYFNHEHGLTVAGGVDPTAAATTTSGLPVTVSLPATGRVSIRTTSSLPITVGMPNVDRASLRTTGTLPVSVSLPAVGRVAGKTTSDLPITVAAPSVARSVVRTTSGLPITVAMPAVASQPTPPFAIDMHGSGAMSVAFVSNPLSIDMSGSGSLTIGDFLTTQSLGIDMSGSATADAVIPRVRVTDPVTGRAPYRLVVVDMQGNRIAELDKVQISPIADELNGMGGFEFTMSADDPKAIECQVPNREIQVWRGRDLLGWCVLVRARGDDKSVTFAALGLEWYFTRRVVGRAPMENLIRNGSFEVGDRYWSFSYVTGSIPAKPPVHSITTTTLNGTKALQISGAAGSQTSSQILQGDVAFAFDSATLTSAGIAEIDALMATIVTDDPDIRCEGHADSTGTTSYNYTLSLNRAQAVADRIYVTKPDANVTVVGYGETRPRATNSTSEGRALNRRVEIEFSELLKATGHRQYAGQWFTISNPTTAKKAKALTLVGWCMITAFTGASKDGYGVYMQMTDVVTNKVIKTTFVPIDEYTPRGRWNRMECSFDLPANSRTYRIDVRLYPPEGTCIWDEISVTAAEQLAFYDTDETLIAKGLVEHAQDTAVGKSNLNIGFEGILSGIKRTREYPWIERMQIEEALSEFPTLADGLDLSMDLTATTRKVHAWFPRKGKNRGYVLALGSNVATFSMDYDGQQTATRVIVQAEGEGSDREEGVFTDTTKMGGTVLETVYNATPGSAISSLKKQAERGIARYSRPIVLPQVVMDPKFTDEILDRVSKGDVVRTIIKKGWIDIDALYRVTSLTLDPATDSVVFALTPEDVSV